MMRRLVAILFPGKTAPLVPPPPEGAVAHERALQEIAKIDNRWEEIHEATEAHQRVRARNHFAEDILHIFGNRG